MCKQMNHKEHLEATKKLVNAYENCFDEKLAATYRYGLMRYHVRSLIYQAEKFQEIVDTWIDIEENGKVDDAEDFYSIVQDILGGGSDD